MRNGTKLFAMVAMLAMFAGGMAGCSGASMDGPHKAMLAAQITATCNDSQEISAVTEANVAFWRDAIADSKKLFGGVTFNATYLDLANQKLGWTQAGLEKLRAGQLTANGISEFRVRQCEHLSTLQRAVMGVK